MLESIILNLQHNIRCRFSSCFNYVYMFNLGKQSERIVL